jgi:hypothetical protein
VGCIYLAQVGTSVELLWTWSWTFGFHTPCGIWLAE